MAAYSLRAGLCAHREQVGTAQRLCLLSLGHSAQRSCQSLLIRGHGPSRRVQLRAAATEKLTHLVEPEDKDQDITEAEFVDFDAVEEDDSSLSTQQVQTLLAVVCEETDIAELELQIGGFALKVRRSVTGEASSSGATAMPFQTMPQPSPFISTSSIDEAQILPTPQSSNGSSPPSVDEDDDVDENLLYIGSPKVGILRRGRYIKGKKVGKGPMVDLGARVKKGQTLAFIEQLGTFVPVEAPQAGEISAFLVDDGKAVEYKEVILEIAPFFGGHIIGDRKYA